MTVPRRKSKSLEQRLLEKTDTSKILTDCWVFLGCKDSSGYGNIGNNGKTISAHRASYELYRGQIPKDKQIDHICGNRLCINPQHLDLVTAKENVRRGRQKFTCVPHPKPLRTHCMKGHPYSGANLFIDTNKQRRCMICKRAIDRKAQNKRRAKKKLEGGYLR